MGAALAVAAGLGVAAFQKLENTACAASKKKFVHPVLAAMSVTMIAATAQAQARRDKAEGVSSCERCSAPGQLHQPGL